MPNSIDEDEYVSDSYCGSVEFDNEPGDQSVPNSILALSNQSDIRGIVESSVTSSKPVRKRPAGIHKVRKVKKKIYVIPEFSKGGRSKEISAVLAAATRKTSAEAALLWDGRTVTATVQKNGNDETVKEQIILELMMTIIEDDYKMLEGMDQAAFMEALVSISCIRDVDKVEYCSKESILQVGLQTKLRCQAIDKSVVKTDSASIRLSSLLKAFIESVVRGSINAQEIIRRQIPNNSDADILHKADVFRQILKNILDRNEADFAQYCYDIRPEYNEAENRMSNEPMTDKFVYPDLARNYIPGGQERFRCVFCNSDSMFLQLPQWLLPFLSYMVVDMTSEALSDAEDNYSGLHKYLAKYMKRRRSYINASLLRRNVLFNKPANDRLLISNQNFTEPAFLNEMNKVTSGFWVNTRAFTAYALTFLGYKNFEQYGNRKTKLNEVLLINRSAAARLTIKKPLLGVDILYMLEKIKPDNFNSV